MNIFGLEITIGKALPRGTSPVATGSGGWFGLVREPFTGAWQRNLEIHADAVLTYSAVYRCISLIESDISKMRIRLVQKDAEGIWTEVEANVPFWPVLRKPNRYQTRIQFFANWVESKLIHGNSYILKERDARGIVTRLYVLNPMLVTIHVQPPMNGFAGDIFYELSTDHLAQIDEPSIMVPASEIIHDRYNATFGHPLIGVSPIQACGIAATQGLKIQESSAQFFGNGATPGGVLTAEAHINDDTAKRLKDYWDRNYGTGGPNVGKVAVLGDGLKYEPMMMTAVDAQLIDQLKMTGETVCSVFGVPPYMAGIGPLPTYNNIEQLNLQYYSQCLQPHIESIELLLDEGLELPKPYGTEFDLDDLLRMDSKTKMDVVSAGVQRGIFSPNEGRFRFNMKPVEGGDSPYLQEQNWPLEHLSERELPSRSAGQPTAPAEIEDNDPEADDSADAEQQAEHVERSILEWARWHDGARAA